VSRGIDILKIFPGRFSANSVFRRFSFVAVLALLVSSCIEPFHAEIDDEPKLISIEGSLIKGSPRQRVVVSRTTSLSNPRFNPVQNCIVRVVGEDNKVFTYEEHSDGVYSLIIPDDELIPGRKYKLHILTPDGDEYESESVVLQKGVEIDSLYYNIEERVESYTGNELNGLQFYADIEASDSVSRFFRWKIEETYEYTSAGPIDFYYYDLTFDPVIPDDIWGLYRCWLTEEIQGIFLSSTINLASNEKKRIPLHYVSTETDRLKIQYSLLLHQYPVDEDAYNYFVQNKTATEGSGELYTRQPQQPLTNIFNVNNPDERVLGYFWLSSRSSKRIIIKRPDGLMVRNHFYPTQPFSMEDHGTGPFPLYIMLDEASGTRITGSPYCFDCRRRGGTTTRPDYWQ
jgi:hypothetical protein